MLGRILNSLQYQTKKVKKEWIKTNETLKEYRYTILERTFIHLARHPLVYSSFLVPLLFLVSYSLLTRWQNLPFFSIDEESPIFRNSLNYFSIIWGIQATLVGLLYPIVIGFVGLLFQNQRSARVALRNYFLDSAALFTGLSSLLLVGFMGLQYLILPKLSTIEVRIFSVLNSIWFLLNTMGTIWFLYRTIRFIRHDLRNQNVKKYLLNILYPYEVTKLFRNHLCQNATDYELIPNLQSDKEGELPFVSTNSMFFNFGKVELKRNFKKKVILQDVYFGPLSWACKHWIKRIEKKDKKSQPRQTFLGIKENNLLVINLLPGMVHEGNYDVCRIEGNTRLNWIEKFLIIKSIRFKAHKKVEDDIDTSIVLREFQSDVFNTLQAGQIENFKDSIRNLRDIHSLLIRAGEIRLEKGTKDNLSNLASSFYWGRRLYQDWNRLYVDIFNKATNLIPTTVEYFEHAAYTPKFLFNDTRDSTIPVISHSFMQLGYWLWLSLRDWWVKVGGVEIANQQSHFNPYILNAPYSQYYEDAVYSFVGGWETFLTLELIDIREKQNIEWQDYPQLAANFEQHLRYTVLMLFNSVVVGDIYGSEWIADILQKWASSLSYDLNFNNYHFKRPHTFTLESLSIDGSEAEQWLNENIIMPETELQYKDILAIGLRNYWKDVVCIVIYLLSQMSRNIKDGLPLTVQILRTLFSGKANKPGGERFISLKPFSSATELLQSIIRQYYYYGKWSSRYGNRLNSLIESVASIKRPRMVSGRGYTRTGADDLNSAKFGQLFSLCVTVGTSWDPTNQLESDLRELIDSDDRLARDLKQLLDSYLELIKLNEFGLFEAAFNLLKTNDNEVSFNQSRQIVENGLSRLMEILESHRQNRIANLKIDDERLEKISIAASTELFKKDQGIFPINYFSVITKTGDKQDEKKLILKKMNRGNFTSPLMAQLAINETEWISETMKHNVAAIVLRIVLDQAKNENVETTAEETYWKALKEKSEGFSQSGLSPILLLDNRTKPEWVWNWQKSDYDKNISIPSGLNVSFPNKGVKSYICNFNNIEVFSSSLPYGRSYLFVRELFEKLIVTEFEEGRYVDATISQNYEDKALVDLELSYAINVITGDFPVFCLNYHSTKNKN